MNKAISEIIAAYKAGKLSLFEVKKMFEELNDSPQRYPLSEGQKGLWMLQKSFPEMTAYNVPLCFRVTDLDIEMFKKACCFLMDQFPILKSVIKDENGIPYQIIPSSVDPVFHLEDLSVIEQDQILPYLNEKAKRPFILDEGGMFQIYIFSLPNQEPIVLLNIHHIIFDGSSVLILMKTLFDAYQCYITGKKPDLISLPATYNHFVNEEQKMLNGKDGKSRLLYWRRQLAGTLSRLNLPTDRHRSSSRNYFEGKTCSHLISSDLSERIRLFSKSQQIYLSTFFMGIFKVLLHKYTGQMDIVAGMPVNVRNQERYNQVIGFLINMVPIRSEFLDNESFLEFSKKLQQNIVNGLINSYPFSALVRELKIPVVVEGAPVFQVAFEYQDFFEEVDSRTLPYQFVNAIRQEGEYELVLEVIDQKNGFVLNWKYNHELFDEETIARLISHFTKLMDEVIMQPDLTLDKYSLISDEEKKRLLFDWNNTRTDYPDDKCVHELFKEQADKTPHAIAVVFEDESFTYKELDQKSAVLAKYLQSRGVSPDTLVAICVERSLDMIAGLLGILKAGGAYVPLDTEYPNERLEYILKNSRAGIILTQSKLKEKVFTLVNSQRQPDNSEPETSIIVLDEQWSEIQKEAATKEKLQKKANSHDLAYVIYTSGSTGDPKGVMIPHQALTNFLISMANQPGLQTEDKLLAVTTYSFDIAGLEIFLPLIKGAQCHICDAGTTKDAEMLKNMIQRIKPTIMQATPVTWTMLFHSGWQNEKKVKILCGGEALPESLKQHFVKTNSDAWNLFGPTETTIWSTIDHVKGDTPITIGKPIANTKIYILDSQNQMTPVGIPGELCISGDGLAKGYLGQPELTAEKFIDNPFNPGSKLYRTGDLARWLANGAIECLGRMDFQLKIRGFRIEPGEIESLLNRHSQIKENVVILKEQDVSKNLVAYYVPFKKDDQNEQNLLEELQTYLKAKLPEYMIPSFFIALDKVPLTPNGKVDRKELTTRKIVLKKDRETQSFLPQSEAEQEILEIWRDVLTVDDISVTDGFFEMGGSSLSAVMLAERISKTFNLSFTVKELFKYFNIQQISRYINKQKNDFSDNNILPAEVKNDKSTMDSHMSISNVQIGNNTQDSYPEYYKESLAIIGISCHFPGATNYREFWQNLKDGKESSKFYSSEELRKANVPEEMIQNPCYVPMQLAIEGKDLFDPDFFNLSPKNAALMDPQFRQLLLHSWQAIEDAGYDCKQIPETGVFMSVSNSYYQTLLVNSKTVEPSDEYVAWLLAQGGTIPTMISYELGLTGPSVFIHSNCSSALVALSTAYQNLQLNEAKYALVGASTLFHTSNIGYVYQPGLNFSSDGHCKTFDASADGMIPGEGVGVIVVKKVLDAIEDGDNIYAVVRGVAINNDGSDKAGFYAPSVNGQSKVIQKVFTSTGVDPESIDYVEAHGTATKLGDPIEVMALTDVYQKHTSKKQFCALGSVKTNIGHLDTAAGLAGCIKVALSLKNKQIPPSINFTKPNPDIDFEDSPFYVVDHLQEWSKESTPRRAGLSSFGIGGTNAHAILEEYPLVEISKPMELKSFSDQESFLMPLSAKNMDRVYAYADKVLVFLKDAGSNLALRDLSYTLQAGRKAMENRVIFISNSMDDLIEKLEVFTGKQKKPKDCFQGEVKKRSEGLKFFENDEYDDEIRELIRKWIVKGKLKKIAKLWIKGELIDWKLLYQGSLPHRISLPTYPFARERYGVETNTMEELTERSLDKNTVPAVQESSEMMCFEEVWQEQALPTVSRSEGTTEKFKTLLCFLSDTKKQHQFIETMQAVSPQTKVVFIEEGSKDEEHASENYRVLSNVPETYEQTLQRIQAEFESIDGILYLWTLDDNRWIRDVSPIVMLLQAMTGCGMQPRQFIMASEFSDELDRCYLESWIGFERSLGLVLPGVRIGVILQENSGQEPGIGMKVLTERVWSELNLEKTRSVFYQNEKRHELRIHAAFLKLDDHLPSNILYETILITGGIGALGFLFAEHFAKKKQSVNLILTGRSVLTIENQTRIKNLEKSGNYVFYLQADVCDVEAMKKGVAQAKNRFGSISGVIHAAGIEGSQIIFDKTLQDFQNVLDPKIKGTLILDEVLTDEPLNFICYFSSSSAILGDFGSCDYAIANRFEMTYAHYRNELKAQGKRTGKAFVINWPLWRDGGMGFGEKEQTEFYLKSSGQRFLEAREGVEMFEKILCRNETQHLVVVGQPGRVNRFLGLTDVPLRAPISEVSTPATLKQGRLPEMRGLSVEQCLERDLQDHVSRLLKISRKELDTETNLADFGFDSISLAGFAQVLTNHYGFEITPALFFGYSTLEKLKIYFLEEHSKIIEEFYDDTNYQDTKKSQEVVFKSSELPSLEKKLIQRTQFPTHGSSIDLTEPIAIIGMSGRFPQAESIEEMWSILSKGEDAVQEIPPERFDWKLYYGDPTQDSTKTNCKWGGFIPGVKEFDPLFFEISPKEAECMDPRQRHLLQESWKALEDAGYGTSKIKNQKIGMFTGVEDGDYGFLTQEGGVTSNHTGVLAARLAYFLNLHGPAMAINTACSSSLVATHQAILNLRSGECDTAIVAGVNLMLSPFAYIAMGQAGMLSPDGKCFAFDKRANGMVPGEAVAVVILKRLSKAESDNDHIHAVIRGSGVNYDGKTNGITAPSAVSQAELIKSVYDQNRINPEDIEYVVTHGTGTKLGDPVEINALHNAFKGYTRKQGYCALTSTKSNFGHTFAASGLVSLISLVEALEHESIPASLHCEEENDYINWKESPFYVNKGNKNWPKSDEKERMGAVSAFGMSGTNAHMVIQGYSPVRNENSVEKLPFYLLPLSAKTPEVLQKKTEDMINYMTNVFQMGEVSNNELPAISYSLQEGRFHFIYRNAIVVQDIEAVIYGWKALKDGENRPDIFQGKVTRDFKGQKAIEKYVKDLLTQSRALLNNPEEYRENLYALADFYCQGYEINWDMLYEEQKPQKISLPTYPFAKEIYWIEAKSSVKAGQSLTSLAVHTAQQFEGDRSGQPVVTGVLTVKPIWENKAVVLEESTPEYTFHIVMSYEVKSFSAKEIEAQMEGVSCVQLQSKEESIAKRYEDISIQVFETIKGMLDKKYKGKGLIQILIPSQREAKLFAGLSGLLKTLHLENPNYSGQIIEVDPGVSGEMLLEILLKNSQHPEDVQIRHWKNQHLAAHWEEVIQTEEATIPWKDNGCYLITGGAGGLGLIFCREIANSVKTPTLILTGRSPLSSDKENQLKELEAPGGRIEYRQVDVSQQNEVDALIKTIKDDFAPLRGILHCAGVIKDKFIIKKTSEEFKDVLAPKVAGTLNLDQATRDINLDFFVLFSSTSGALGNPGQSDYSTANAFMDAYSEYRNDLVLSNERQGQTLSINWPLWKEGGMGVDGAVVKSMEENGGIVALDTSCGIQALIQGLAVKQSLIMVMQGDTSRIKKGLLEIKSKVKLNLAERSIPPVDNNVLHEKTLHELKRLLSKVIKLSMGRIESREPLESYGIDSMLITELNQRLEEVFGDIPKTLFYEYLTLNDLTGYFIAEYSQECIAWVWEKTSLHSIEPSTSAVVEGEPVVVTSIKTEVVKERCYASTKSVTQVQEPIAIIGMAGHYPEADTIEEYWDNLKTGRSCITEIPSQRWALAGFYEADIEKAFNEVKSHCRLGGFLKNFSNFDPMFFNISPAAVFNMDPHERLMLTTSWEAMEAGGYTPETLQDQHNGSVGVFIGITKSGFNLHTRLGATLDTSQLPFTSFSAMANRVSYHLNLTGPSMAIDTMCSSSITVIHEACEHIRRGDCQLAIAGAVNLYLHSRNYIDLSLGKMITDEDEIHCFSKSGKGFIPGEGVGTVLLKSLSRAVADGDHIDGIIIGTGINHGGKTNGYTVPNLTQQRELILNVLERSGCEAANINYIESAANGSAMGDAIEIDALRQVFQKRTGTACRLGTLKPNIGHLEAASGISQLTKVLCQMKRQTLVPTLVNHERLDESLHREQSPFQLVTELQPWPSSKESPHKALITSFGAGGSYAAMVVEQYINSIVEPPLEVSIHGTQLVLLSARTEGQLKSYARRLNKYLETTEVSMSSLAYTLQQGRVAMRYRLAIIVKDQKELLNYLKSYLENQTSDHIKTGDAKQFKTMREYLSLQEIEDRVSRALAKRDMETVAHFWLKGFDDIVWDDLYGGRVTRICLPTYPFESRSFWYEDQNVLNPLHQPEVHSGLHSLEVDKPIESAQWKGNRQSLKEIQANLAGVVKEILFMHEEDELDEDDTFLDLGLDSISVILFVRKLSQKLNMPLRETLVFDYPTIGALAGYIAQQPSLNVQHQGNGGDRIKEEPVRLKDNFGGLMKEYDEVVPLQMEGQGPLLFCIHPMSGDVGLYMKLAEAAQKRFRVVGIKSRGFLSNKSPLTTIEAMGGYYAEIITAIDPDGPYNLFGVSMGGTVAYETARHLLLQKKRVTNLFLLESPLIENDEDGKLWDSDKIHNWIMNSNFLMISMLHLDPGFRQRKEAGEIEWSKLEITCAEVKDVAEERLADSLVELIRQRGVKQTAPVLIERLESMAQIHLVNLRALSRYRANHFPGQDNMNAVLLRTRTADAVSSEVYNPDYLINVQQTRGSMLPFFECWKKVLPQLEVTVVDGENHFDILNTRTTIQHLCDLIANRMKLPPEPVPDGTAKISGNKQIGHGSGMESKIAIVGMSGQFPGAKTVDDFWGLLKEGRSAFTEFPQNRNWDLAKLYDSARGFNKTYVRHGGFLEDIDRFDPLFFQISPKEAEMMDPSERFFLQESWKALEDAGIDLLSLSGKSWGVFCGGGGDYTLTLKERLGVSPHVTVSNIPGRVSYSLNLTGPCLSVDVGCASSLLAIAQACDHLMLDKCEAAIAGGVLIYSTPNLIVAGSQTKLFSHDAHCSAFDERANGMMPGEAVGVLVLKPLSKAVADGDRIHGVIEGWGNNHNGKTNGMAAPGVAAETALFTDVYRRFQIDPETINMVEANATGTPLGDMIEVQALTDAFRTVTAKRNYCALGSVENNIGHAFQSSGMNHVMKVLLALRHSEIPATLNVETPNPALDLGNSPFFINNSNRSWKADAGQVRRAAVSSFGATGTNVHLVITEAPTSATLAAQHFSESSRPVLITLSGKTKNALKQRCIEFKAFLESKEDREYPNLSQLSANLLLRRCHFSERCALVVSNREELETGLLALIKEDELKDGFTGTVLKDVKPFHNVLGRMISKTIVDAKKTEKDDLLVMADLYVQGVSFDLPTCFSEADKFPLSLPAYPFETRRCWFETQDEVNDYHKEEFNTALSILVSIQKQVMGITGYNADEVDVDTNFSRLGLDSLMSIRLLAAVNEQFSMEIQLVDLLDHNNIRRLVALIEKEKPGNGQGAEEPTKHNHLEAVSENVNRLSNQLSNFPNALHILSLDGESDATRERSLEYNKDSLGKLTKNGIAVFHEGSKCNFISHKSINIQSVLDTFALEQLRDLSVQLHSGEIIAPVSGEQERNLYHSEVMRQSAWNIQHVYEVTINPLDLSLLNKAMVLVVKNHDILRTYFMPLGTSWVQIIKPDVTLEFQLIEMQGLPDFQRFIAIERDSLLRLDTPPLLQARVCQIGEIYYLGFVTHHSLADAFTTSMLFSELMNYYQSLLKQEKPILKLVGEQYWHYSLSQFDKSVYQRGKTIEYWKEELADGVLSMQLPFVSEPLKVEKKELQAADGNMVSLSTDLNKDIKLFSREHEISFTQLFTTAITMLLIHGMGNARAVIQFINNQRDRNSLMNTPGEFTNVLFIPFDIDPESSILNVLQNGKRKSLNSLAYAKINFTELLALTGLENYENYYRQLGDVIIDSTDIDAGTLDSSKGYGRSLFADILTMKDETVIEGTAIGTLFYQILKVNHGIHLITSYRKQLFGKAEMQQLSALIVQVVEEMVHNPEQRVKEILSRLHNSFNMLQKQSKRYKLPPRNIYKKNLSEGQKGLWLLQQLEPEMSAYNVPVALKIHDEIQVEILKQTFGFMLKKHPILQSVITTDDDGNPILHIDNERPLCFEQKSIQLLTEGDFQKLLKTTFKQPFKLDRDPLMRVHLFSKSSDEHILLVTIHHILFDGASVLVFINDLLSAYKTFSTGRNPVLKSKNRSSYFDFVDWEQDYLVSEKGKKHLAYWKEQLSGELPILEMPLDKARPAMRTYAGATCSAGLSPELTVQLRRLAKEQGVSLFVVLLAIYKTLLCRYTNQSDIIVGTPMSGRPEKRFESVIGYFINMINIRSSIDGNQPFSDYLEQLKRTVAYGLDNAAYPFPKLISQLNLKSSAVHSPVFQTIFVLQNFFSKQIENDLTGKNPNISVVQNLHQEGDFDLSMEVVEGEKELSIHLSYNLDIFNEKTINRFIEHYTKLAHEIIKNPYQPIGLYDLLSKNERDKLLIEWNNTRTDHPEDKCIHELFEEQASKTPEAVALVFAGRQVTYEELDRKSAELAKYLQSLGVKPDTLVAVCVERSIEMIVGLLGVFRSGGAYVPLDPEFPDERIRYMLEDSQAVVLVTQDNLSGKFANIVDKNIQIVYLDKKWNGVESKNELLREVKPDHLAYVIYTSGSTGKPKGVLISHASIAHHSQVVRNYYNLTADDNILQFSSINVDASLEQILPGLITGARLIVRNSEVWSPKEFLDRVTKYGISVIDIPPAYLHELLLQWSQVPELAPHEIRLVITGGEALTPETVNLWQNSHMNSIRLINAYGPTETTITSVAFEITARTPTFASSRSIPIGRPLDNETVYILDKYGNPVPMGVVGELHISGAGVAVGYLNRPELTLDKFIDNPFKPGTKMYKTGDLTRWLADGNIEYLGRIDHQVKIRGFRIECGEIESILNEQENIGNALVVAQTINESSKLIAYFVPVDQSHSIDIAQLKRDLQVKLPDYMVPSAFVSLSKIPLIPSGKIDRNALMQQNIELTDNRGYVEPKTETEKRLTTIWGNVLKVKQVGIKDNFFDIGGNSLLAVRLMAEIYKEFGRELPISILFLAPDIAEQGDILDRQIEKSYKQLTPLVPIKPKGELTPFFYAHPVGGGVLSYWELAYQPENKRPVYGLQSPGLYGCDHPGSIEEMGSLYIDAMQTIQDHGPYYLGGWSMGGVIAYEMARQLQQAGEDIALLVLIDSYTPFEVKSFEEQYIKEYNLEVYDQELLLLGSFARDLGLYDGTMPTSISEITKNPDELLEQILEQAKRSNILSPGLESDRMRQLFKEFKANTLAMNSYHPKPIEGKVILFCADGLNEQNIIIDPAKGWSELLNGNLVISRIPGTHYTILKKPNVERIMLELRGYL